MTSPADKKIVVLPGDGIGVEVIAEAVRVIDWFRTRRGLAISIEHQAYGADAYRRYGSVLPPATEAALSTADAILFGATGGPEFDEIPLAARRQGSLLHIRRSLQLYANLRPIVTIPALYDASSLKNRVLQGVDFIIVRELIGGIYFGEPRGIETLPNGERRGVNTQVYTTSEIRRVARFAFELARSRRGVLCSVDKSNVMEAGQLWRAEVQQLHDEEFPDVALSHMFVDNCAMQIIRKPAQFDVLLTDNIFGDILSDCAAMLTGSLGMLPSAALGPADSAGRRPAFYEPVHGSAPDIAGKGIANPLGAILSLAMALRLSLGWPQEAVLLEESVADAMAGGARTADIAAPGSPSISCSQMGDAVLAALEARCSAPRRSQTAAR